MQTRRIVITGINGFVGHHLARQLVSEGVSVIGVGQDDGLSSHLKDIVHEYHTVNLVESWPNIPDVDGVVHLAGLAAVGPSFDKPQLYINANSAMVTNMGEYYLQQKKRPRIVVVSSGAVYDPHQPMPITEASSIGFTSPYAVSKILVENQCAYYKNRGLDCIIVRPFNHIGPGQNKGFIVPDFFERLSQLDPATTSIQVGNIQSKRDYTDVRDIVRAYSKLILAPTLAHTLYNVCSGTSVSGEEILNHLKKLVGKPEITFEIDQSLVRPTDPAEIVGDSSRLQTELDWHPTYQLKDTIKDFVASVKKDT